MRLPSRARDVHDGKTHRAEDPLAELAVAHSIAPLALFTHEVRRRPFRYLSGFAMIRSEWQNTVGIHSEGRNRADREGSQSP